MKKTLKKMMHNPFQTFDMFCDASIMMTSLTIIAVSEVWERLNSYTEFIKEHLEENITELIVTMIEGYDEETFEKNIRRNYEGKEIKEGD